MVLGCVFAMVWLVDRACLPNIIWDGAKTVPVGVRILGPENRPIAGAKIWALAFKYDEEPTDEELAKAMSAGVTDKEGKARLRLICGAGGSSGLFGKKGSYVVSQNVLIKAEGYRTIFTPLSNFVGGYGQPLKRRQIEFEVRMLR